MKRNRKSKILSTLGPSSSSPEIIEKLFIEGTDVFRLNFSHGTIEEHRKNSEIIRSLEKKYDYSTCILADLQGPKLRIGSFKNKKEQLKLGQKSISRHVFQIIQHFVKHYILKFFQWKTIQLVKNIKLFLMRCQIKAMFMKHLKCPR